MDRDRLRLGEQNRRREYYDRFPEAEVERRRFQHKQRQKEQKRDERREAIKSAAIEMFADKGFHAAKVSDIVAEVGVAQGTFYLYYDGKKQIFEEILNDFLSLLLETIANWEPGDVDSRQDLGRELRRVGMRLTDIIAEREKLGAGGDADDV
ncbi:MAG: TetR/AcrR family transcriptional regulator [Bradymonadaceae bacterium]